MGRAVKIETTSVLRPHASPASSGSIEHRAGLFRLIWRGQPSFQWRLPSQTPLHCAVRYGSAEAIGANPMYMLPACGVI